MLEFILLLMSVVAAGVPMIGYLLLMRWMDRYEREPLGLVAAAFGWGAIGAISIAIVGSLILMLPLELALDEGMAMFMSASLVAPIVEEPAKALCLLLLYRSREFDNATDGFVYGAAAGLGFGMSENFLYFASTVGEGVGVWVFTVIVRTLFTGLMHAAATSMVGAALGWAKFSTSSLRTAALPLALLSAVGMHALWNSFAIAPVAFEDGGALPLVSFMLFPLEFITLFVIFQASLYSESRLIRRELKEEARLGNFPPEHVAKVASWSQRKWHENWMPRDVDGEEYIKVATRLAFRKKQRDARPEDSFYAEEVDRLRGRLRELLSGAGATARA